MVPKSWEPHQNKFTGKVFHIIQPLSTLLHLRIRAASLRAAVLNIENLPSKQKFRNSSYLVKHFRKSQSQFPKNFSFSRKPANGEMLPHAVVAGQKPLNKTIFNALGKKDGSRKEVHLWQVSKASQLQYYSVKILQDNELFTRFKNARRFLSSALSQTMKFCETLKEKITA